MVKRIMVVLVMVLAGIAVTASSTQAAPAKAGCEGQSIAYLENGTTEIVCPIVVHPGDGMAKQFHDCLGNKLCLWINKEYLGALYMYPNYSDGRKVVLTAANNAVSSVRSRLTAPSNHIALHGSAQCIDINPLGVNPDQAYNNLHDFGYGDQFSCINYGG